MATERRCHRARNDYNDYNDTRLCPEVESWTTGIYAVDDIQRNLFANV